VTGRWTRRGLYLTGRVQSVFSICACFSLMIGRTAHPVTVDRTCPVIQGAYWTPTGRWHCGVRSVLQRVRSLFCCALLRLDQCVRLVTGPACLINPSASGLRDEHVWSVLHDLAVATSASGQLDQRVRSARLRLFQVSNGSIRRGMSINTCWPAQGSHS
jgi:hypothetical protein